MPNARSGKGIPRFLNEDTIAEIYRIKEEHPHMNATQIYEHLVRESFIPATVSVDSVQRFIRHNDLKSARPMKKMNSVKYGRDMKNPYDIESLVCGIKALGSID